MMPSSLRGKFRNGRAKFHGRVLIVDDEPLVRWSLAAGLRAAGFDAVTASSAEEALTLAREHPRPDVILVDLRLYDVDPLTLLEELQSIAPRCRFLGLLTAGQDVPLLLLDRVRVIEKPFDLPGVVRLVDATVAA